MATEVNTEAEVAAQVTPEVIPAEVTPPAVEPTLAELQAKLAEERAAKAEALRKLEEEHKALAGHQRTNQRLTEELRRRDAQLVTREDLLALAEAVLPEDDVPQEPVSKLQQIKARLRPAQAPKEQTPQAPTFTPEQQAASAELMAMCQQAGITDLNNPPAELAVTIRRANKHFAAGDLDDARDVLREGLEAYKGKSQQQTQEAAARQQAAREMVTPRATPQGAGDVSNREFIRLWGLNQLPNTPANRKRADELLG